MQPFLPTVILRHRRENLKKCSLRGLEKRPDFVFHTYPKDPLPRLAGYIMLALDAPELQPADGGTGLFVLDGTWRYANKMRSFAEKSGPFLTRSIPGRVKTVYPRRQEDCIDPEAGLASIEAIYTAYRVLGWNTDGLLDRYHWKTQFLDKNKELFDSFEPPS